MVSDDMLVTDNMVGAQAAGMQGTLVMKGDKFQPEGRPRLLLPDLLAVARH